MGIAPTLLNLKRQTLHAAPHIGMTGFNPHPDAGRDGNHRCALALDSEIPSRLLKMKHSALAWGGNLNLGC
jgi:hypothetical protein